MVGLVYYMPVDPVGGTGIKQVVVQNKPGKNEL
jgi:hypothetical protein